MEKEKELNEKTIEKLADSIYNLFKKNDVWSDVCIYFNGKRLDNKDDYGDYHYDGNAYLHGGFDPRDYFECVNPDHILSMSFEGPVYHMFNYGKYKTVLKRFDELLKRYGLYYELGDAWNLTLYKR